MPLQVSSSSQDVKDEAAPQQTESGQLPCVSMYFLPSDLMGAGGASEQQPPAPRAPQEGASVPSATAEPAQVEAEQYAEQANGSANATGHSADDDGDTFGGADFVAGEYAGGNDAGSASRQRKRRPRRRRAAARTRGDTWEQPWEARTWQSTGTSPSSVAYAAELPVSTAPADMMACASTVGANVAATAATTAPLPAASAALAGGVATFPPFLSTTPMLTAGMSAVSLAMEAGMPTREDVEAVELCSADATMVIPAEQVTSASVASKWHSSALSAGKLSEDGHVFAKTHVGPRKSHSNGMTLSSLCMLFERTLRVGGIHQYHYSIVEGSVGAADGVGFVFDSRIRRTNIQRMRSVFLNKHGQVCIRNLDSIIKLPCSLPKLSEGVSVHLTVDLNHAAARFKMDDPTGKHCGTADLSFASLLTSPGIAAQASDRQLSAITQANLAARSGFFCAIVTGSITVSLH